MSKLSLPTELWAQIITDNCLELEDRYSVVLVNKQFNSICTPFLYSNLRISLNPNNSSWMKPSISWLVDRLADSKKLRSYIRRCSVIGKPQSILLQGGSTDEESVLTLLEHLILLLVDCPRLEIVSFHNLQLRAGLVSYLASTPDPPLSMEIHGCYISGLMDRNKIYTVRSLKLTGSGVSDLWPLISNASLESLSLTDGLYTTPASFVDQLTSLKHLHIASLTGDMIWLMNKAPNLVELTFDFLSMIHPLSQEWERTLPKLEKLKVFPQLVPLLTAGRPLKSVIIASYDDRPFRIPHFGSNKPILNVHWDTVADPTDFIYYLIEKNVEVENFSSNKPIITFKKVCAFSLINPSLKWASRGTLYHLTLPSSKDCQSYATYRSRTWSIGTVDQVKIIFAGRSSNATSC